MIVRVSVSHDKMLAESLCGEGRDYYYDIVIYSADGRPMFTTKSCEVSVGGRPVYPEEVVLVEAVKVVIEKSKVWISTDR